MAEDGANGADNERSTDRLVCRMEFMKSSRFNLLGSYLDML